MRTKGRRFTTWARLAVVAATFAAVPALAAACGARSELDDLATRPADRRDAAPDVVVVDAPPDIVVIDAPPDVTPIDPIGCADGTREAFLDLMMYPRIAGCSGAFSVPGLFPDAPPSCGRLGGNTGLVPLGLGCGAVDLCSLGWHLCRSAAEVAKRSHDGCVGAGDAPPDSFFATGQSGPGCGVCATGTIPGCGGDSCEMGCAPNSVTTNDVFGCGNTGDTPDPASCGVLDRFSNNLCMDIPSTWVCPSAPNGDVRELVLVTKVGAEGGGVLCCRD